MEEYRQLRTAMRELGIKVADLAGKIGKCRHTVSRYITVYESTGKVGDRRAQDEFDSIILRIETSRAEESDREVSDLVNEAKRLSQRNHDHNREYYAYVRGLAAKYGVDKITVWKDKKVSLINPRYGIPEECILDSPELKDLLTAEEKGRLEEFSKEYCEISDRELDVGRRKHRAVLNNLWVKTEPMHMPVQYDDWLESDCCNCEEFRWPISDFCMVSGEKARIRIETDTLPYSEDEEMMACLKVDLYVITDRDVVEIDSRHREIDYDRVHTSFDFEIMPGYRYLYRICYSETPKSMISGGACPDEAELLKGSEEDEEALLRHVLYEGLATPLHPLK